jgi:hypothetical protein
MGNGSEGMSSFSINSMAMRKAAAMQAKKDAITTVAPEKKEIEWIAPEDAKERIVIVFDDSYSMDASLSDRSDYATDTPGNSRCVAAKEGCVEFLRNCIPNQTAVAIQLLNVGNNSLVDYATLTPFTTNLPAKSVAVATIKTNGGTPLYTAVKDAVNKTPTPTRIVAFSDGDATDKVYAESAIALCKERSIPVDTFFLGEEGYGGFLAMRELAEKTGGIFIHYIPGKTSIKQVFKCLAPVNRLALMSGDTKSKLERGEL